MNKKLELYSVGIVTIIFSIFLLIKDSFSPHSIILLITGLGVLLYGIINKKKISDFNNPEVYDERDEIIYNKASNIVLTILTYLMLIALLLNSFVSIPLNYVLVFLIALTVFGKQLIIKAVGKFYDT